MIEVTDLPPDPKCDFCSQRPVVMYYPADDYLFVAVSEDRVIEQPSEGGWAACRLCSVLVDAEDYPTLAWRAVEHQGGMPEDTAVGRMVRDFMLAWFEGFRDHRRGAGVELR